MKATELIAQLQKIVEDHGDLPVTYTDFSILVNRGNRQVLDIDEVSFHKKLYDVSNDKTIDGILLF